MTDEKKKLYEDACAKYRRYKEAAEIAKELEREWLLAKARFEQLDREDAEKDGRYRKVTANTKKKFVEARELTLDEIKAVAKTLGINLEEE